MTLFTKINRFTAKPENRRMVLLGIGGYCLVGMAFSGLQRLSERVAAPHPTPAPVVAVAPAPAPAAPAHELAWLAEDPAMAKRMYAECGNVTREMCSRFWAMKRQSAGQGETFRDATERPHQERAALTRYCEGNRYDDACH